MRLNIGVIGLGYVGLPLAIELSKKYSTFGYDKSLRRILELKNGNDKNNEIPKLVLNKSKIKFSNKESDLKKINFYIVTVPTPINNNNMPDVKLLKLASKVIGLYLNKGDIVVYESTVYPGLTEEICVPILEKYSGLKRNIEFGYGYSPERINPGDKKNNITNINKIVSGSNSKALSIIFNVYKSIIKTKVYKASSIKVAEAAKVIENTQRDLNIALVNELTQIFEKMNIDTHEVLKAASTKWNFHKYVPGLVGGHCIGVDPYYLTFKANKIGYNPKIILAGRKLNDDMGHYIAKRTHKYLNFKPSKVLILGCTFKQNCNDVRNSKVFDLYKSLKKLKHKVEIFDPIVNDEDVKKNYKINLIKFPKSKHYNCIILAVNHDYFKNKKFKDPKKLFGAKISILFDLKSFYQKKYSDFRL